MPCQKPWRLVRRPMSASRIQSRWRGRFLGSLLLLLIVLAPGSLEPAAAAEVRGLWVDSFHPGLRTVAEVHQLVADARAGHFNTLFVEVRRRGDAFYESCFEPKAVDIQPAGFDPLGYLIHLGHDTNAGPRLEVHAWIVTYNIWNDANRLPSQPDHPFRQRQGWLTQSDAGQRWDGYNFAFDPGHPDVQRHTFLVAMDLIRRYDLDGFHFDYIRYAGTDWGYNPVAVERFLQRYRRARPPAPRDPDWLQFRRDQVTGLVRKVYLSALAAKPRLKISAATIAWAPAVTNTVDWPRSAAYSAVLQDWRGWMQEGILDLNVPMTYFREHTPNSNDWSAWSLFAKENRFGRHVALGAGLYLNSFPQALRQIASTRQPTPNGDRADGVVAYSYAALKDLGLPRDAFASLALGDPAHPAAPPLFPEPVPPPEMPWKTRPTDGHLGGFVRHGPDRRGVDGASLRVSGPVDAETETDATGFFGLVGLPPGRYRVVATHTNGLAAEGDANVRVGQVGARDLLLEPAAP